MYQKDYTYDARTAERQIERNISLSESNSVIIINVHWSSCAVPIILVVF